MTDPAPDHRKEDNRRSLALGIVTILAAFAAGVGVGALSFGGDEPVPTADTPRPPALFQDLDLSPDQQASIDSILSATRAATDSLLEATRTQLTRRAVEARREIETVLTPQQAEALDQRFRTLGPTMVRRVRLNDSLIRVDTIQ